MSALSGQANINQLDQTINTTPRTDINRDFWIGSATFSASQPLYRPQNVIALGQAKEQVTQSDFTFAIAQQDLIIRTAVAYFDVLLAEYNIELAEQQKLAVAEQLAQAKRNFEVGTATITDTNEAQAKYDSIIATEIQARNDLDRRRTALMAIIGHMPKSLKRVGRGFEPALPDPNNIDYWVDKALKENLSVRFAQSNYDIATLEVDRAKAGHYPTLDLVASYQGLAGNGSTSVSRHERIRAWRSSAFCSTSRSTPAASSIRGCGRRSRCRTSRARTSKRRAALPSPMRRTASPA